jgi:hypothetical protein
MEVAGHLSMIDLKTQAAFPIRLGASISKPAEATRFASIRYNYKPVLKKSTADIQGSIADGDDGGGPKLSLQTDEGEYTYSGKHRQDAQSYVLVLRGEGKEREMVLERIDGSHDFDLTATPSEADAEKLAGEHPHLSAAGEGDDLFGDDEADLPPDDSNPFDYRHLLKEEIEKAETAQPVQPPSASVTPRVQPSNRATPIAKAAKAAPKAQPPKKRKTAAEKPSAKRVRAAADPEPDRDPAPEPPKPAKAPKAKPDIPKVRVDRKPSARRPSVDDSGELILENETPTTEKAPRHAGAMAWALSGQLGGGPISLRSAADSPASRMASPAAAKEDEPQEYAFEFGEDVSDDDQDDTITLQRATVPVTLPPEPDADSADGDDDEEDEDEDDADVDNLELPSPAQRPRPSVSQAVVTGGGGGGDDEDDDMEKQLALAMAAEDNESEESEEE